MPSLPALVLLSSGASTVGTLGGLGGSVFLVTALVLMGSEPASAAPLGILVAAAGSLAAAPDQLREGLVHHRIGVTLELAASTGAIIGAAVATSISADVLQLVLAGTGLGAALISVTRRGVRNLPAAEFVAELPGEWPGTLGGTYRLQGHAIPYTARRLPLGLGAMTAAGLVSGVAGVGGGFIKVPAMSEIMLIPVKVAAATSTFTVGITAAAATLVYAGQGRISPGPSAAAVVGGLLGGACGTWSQRRLRPQATRVVLSALLVLMSSALLVTW